MSMLKLARSSCDNLCRSHAKSLLISYLLAQEEFAGHTGVGKVNAGRESVQLGANTLLLKHLVELIFIKGEITLANAP